MWPFKINMMLNEFYSICSFIAKVYFLISYAYLFLVYLTYTLEETRTVARREKNKYSFSSLGVTDEQTLWKKLSTPSVQKHIRPPNSSSLVSHDEFNEHLVGKGLAWPAVLWVLWHHKPQSPSDSRSWWSDIHHQTEARGVGEGETERGDNTETGRGRRKRGRTTGNKADGAERGSPSTLGTGERLMISRATFIIKLQREREGEEEKEKQQDRHTKCWEKAKKNPWNKWLLMTGNNEHIADTITCNTAPGSCWWMRTQPNIKVSNVCSHTCAQTNNAFCSTSQ